MYRPKTRNAKEPARQAAIERLRPFIADPRVIPLTLGWVALVDADVFEELDQHCWCARVPREPWRAYAHRGLVRDGTKTTITMHRQIMGLEPHDPTRVDHRTHEPFPFVVDNRRSNLRLCNDAQNSQNRRKHRGTRTPYRGVSRTKHGGWRAAIGLGGVNLHLGIFVKEHYAALARDYAARQLHGAFAACNFPSVEGPVDIL